MTKYLIAVVLGMLALYGLTEARPLLLGPALSIDSPLESERLGANVVTLTGKAFRVAALTLNGMELLPDQNGIFSSTFALPSGTSILTLKAEDRFGRTITKTRTVFVP